MDAGVCGGKCIVLQTTFEVLTHRKSADHTHFRIAKTKKKRHSERIKQKSIGHCYNWGMPLLFLISELVHSKYFDSAAILHSIYNQFIRTQVMDTTTKMVTTKDDITFKKLYVL